MRGARSPLSRGDLADVALLALDGAPSADVEERLAALLIDAGVYDDVEVLEYSAGGAQLRSGRPPGALATAPREVLAEELLISDAPEADSPHAPVPERYRKLGFRTADRIPLERDGRTLGLFVGLRRDDPARVLADRKMIASILSAALAQERDRAALLEGEKREQRFLHALRASRSGAWEWEVATNRVVWSEENFEMLGYDPAEVSASYEAWFHRVHPEDQAMASEAVQRALERRGDLDMEFRVLLDDGTIRWIRDVGRLVTDDQGRPKAMYGIQIDVTERKQAELEREQVEERLRSAEHMEAIGRLAGGVAHDFNNLLTVILGMSEIAIEREAAEGIVRQELTEILLAAERGAALTGQLLAFARRKPFRRVVLDLNERLADLDPILRRLIAEDIQIEIDLQSDLDHVQADPGQIDQLVLNLAANARDAMPRGGRLTIRTRNVVLDRELTGPPGPTPAGDYVCLSVSDTGVGMDEQTVARAFEPFFTTKPLGSGTGLGLATVYGIVSVSRGHLRVRSTPGEGSTIDVLFPRSTIRKPEEAAPRAAEAGSGSGTILVVEDDAAVRNILRTVLSSSGYEILEAGNVSEAIDVFERRGAEIDLLITDVVMPGGSGPELARTLSERIPRIKVLFISGYVSEPDSDLLTAGAQLLEKPFKAATLLERVRVLTG